MNPSEFLRIRGLLKVYPFCMQSKDETDAWWESLKAYDYATIDSAVRNYISRETHAPTPAAIINLIPKAWEKLEYKPRYETVNGEQRLVIQCRRCRDTGLIIWADKTGALIGRPCNCPAGHDKYHWGWLTREQQEAYVRSHGSHGEIVGESWYED